MTHPAIGLSMSQRRALSEMGIDVWVRRAPVPPSAERGASTPASVAHRTRADAATGAKAAAKRGAVAEAADAAPSRPAAADYRAELDCLAAPGVVIVGRWQNALDKRLATDVAAALGGCLANSAAVAQPPSAQRKLQQTAFRWPVTQTGDASFAAACGAFRAFVRGQTERAQARCVVLFGEVAAALGDGVESAVAAAVVRQPAIGALRADPNAKKALWLNVSQHVLA